MTPFLLTREQFTLNKGDIEAARSFDAKPPKSILVIIAQRYPISKIDGPRLPFTMGFDCGFDVHPRLEATTENIQTYQQFLDEVVRTYNDVYDKRGRREDGKVLEMPKDSDYSKDCIWFMVGECPHMPSNPNRCDYFLRFSSKISGHLTTPAEPYIKDVYQIAKKHFGSRVHFWHEMNETGDERQWGYYDWQEIHDATENLGEVEAGQEGGLPKRALVGRKEMNDEPSGPPITGSKSGVVNAELNL